MARDRARSGGRRTAGPLAAGTAVALALATGESLSQAGAATQPDAAAKATAAAQVTTAQATAAQATAAQATAAESKKPKPTHSQIDLLPINDFHGILEPATGSGG